MDIKLDTIEVRPEHLDEFRSSGRRFRVTAFTSSHKIEGTAFVAMDEYNDSWRSSDFLRSVDGERLVIGDVEIRNITTGTIVDQPGFVMLNLDAVEVLYARELDEE